MFLCVLRFFAMAFYSFLKILNEMLVILIEFICVHPALFFRKISRWIFGHFPTFHQVPQRHQISSNSSYAPKTLYNYTPVLSNSSSSSTSSIHSNHLTKLLKLFNLSNTHSPKFRTFCKDGSYGWMYLMAHLDDLCIYHRNGSLCWVVMGTL